MKSFKIIIVCVCCIAWQAIYAQEVKNTFLAKGVWESTDIPAKVCAHREGAAVGWTDTEIFFWGGFMIEGDDDFIRSRQKGNAVYSKSNGWMFVNGWIYNIETDKWRAMPAPPVNLNGFYVDHYWTGRYILVFNRKASTSAYFDTQTQKWFSFPYNANMQKDRVNAAMGWTGEEFYIWGGKNWASNQFYNDGMLFNPLTKKWRSIPKTDLLSPRHSMLSTKIADDLVFSCGNDSNGKQKDGAAFNLKTQKWRKIADAPKASPVFHQWVTDSKILLSGQEEYIYDIQTNSWSDAHMYEQIKDVTWYSYLTYNNKFWFMGTYLDQASAVYDPETDETKFLASNHNVPLFPESAIVKPINEYHFVIIAKGQVHHYYPYRSRKVEFSYTKGKIKDARDGQTYQTVKIGESKWLAENMRYETAPGSYLCHNDQDENCDQYGKLYHYKVAEEVCPAGWRLPTKEDYENLIKLAGGANSARHFVATDESLFQDKKFGYTPTNYMGFNSLLPGIYTDNYKDYTRYWTSTLAIAAKGDDRRNAYYSFELENSFFAWDRSDVRLWDKNYDRTYTKGSKNKSNALAIRCIEK